MMIVSAMGKQCQAKEGATDQDFNEFITRTVPTTQTSKCLHACVMETLNVVCFKRTNVSFFF